jgi:hypothetical protein
MRVAAAICSTTDTFADMRDGTQCPRWYRHDSGEPGSLVGAASCTLETGVAMVDTASMGARLGHLRHQLDNHGVHGKDESRTWDDLVDLYGAAPEEAATATGIEPPGPPRSVGRRFTREAREQLEAALTAPGLRVR